MERTVVNHDIERPVLGYMVNATFDKASVEKIRDLQVELRQEFGDSLWMTPPDTLHITLMDWLAPLVEYGEDKQDLFDRLFPSYDAVFARIVSDYNRITIDFSEVKATPGAIIIIGQDDGVFNDIRSRFTESIDFLPNTKQPPTIVHSSIARYKQELELDSIVRFLGQHSLHFMLEVDRFRLVQEDIMPQLERQVLKEYLLSSEDRHLEESV